MSRQHLSSAFRYMSRLCLIALAVMSSLCVPLWGAPQTADDDDGVIIEEGDSISEFDSDELIRENPDMQWGEDLLSDYDYSRFPFLNLDANRIELNGSDWSGLAALFAGIEDEVVSIVHIGDSHIQGEGSTSRTRNLLQRRFGSAGRGLIIPFRLAGTNQPSDYTISSSSSFTSAKLVTRHHDIPVGFTGIALRPRAADFDFRIALRTVEGVSPDFDFIRLFGHGDMPSLESAYADGAPVGFDTEIAGDTLSIFLYEPVRDVILNLHTAGRCDIYGFLIENWMQGVEYSAIGNNGAGYISYNEVGKLGSGIRALNPDLVIISLGTNEAFGKMTDDDFYRSIDRMVKDIRLHNPEALILLETPAECQRSVTTRTPVKRRNRRGRVRTSYRTTRSYQVNTNIRRLRDVILRYGRDSGIATYDWYEAAGGANASHLWLNDRLLSGDRIHDTWDGYLLHGSMLYDALINTIQQ